MQVFKLYSSNAFQKTLAFNVLWKAAVQCGTAHASGSVGDPPKLVVAFDPTQLSQVVEKFFHLLGREGRVLNDECLEASFFFLSFLRDVGLVDDVERDLGPVSDRRAGDDLKRNVGLLVGVLPALGSPVHAASGEHACRRESAKAGRADHP